jgi:carboxyl-terminal processing protease
MTLRALCIFAVLLTAGAETKAQPDTLCAKQQLVFSTLMQLHYSPPEFNTRTRDEVLDIFLREADERNLFFLAGDRELLSRIGASYPAPEAFCEIAREASKILIKRAAQVDSAVARILMSELLLDGSDSLTFVPAKKGRTLCRDIHELASRVEKRIKYDCLQDLCVLNARRSEHLLYEGDHFPAAKSAAIKRSVRKLQRYLATYRSAGNLDRHLTECMSNAIARRFDPHSGYFSSRALHLYNNSLSAQESSFGFHAEPNDSGKIVVTQVIAGSSAAKEGAMRPGDVIVSFSFGQSELICVDSCGPEAFLEQLYGDAHPWVKLLVKRASDPPSIVKLAAQEMPSEENSINGYVISHRNRRLGYIPVPSFFTGGHGCASAVAREIINLMKDSITGLLIDLRFNGGGSMREAMALAGLFIHEGPVAMYRPASGEPFALKDLHRGTVWDGPLVILVNAASASASEFFSAAMQDHERAIVAGSATFGKGSAQSIFPLDTGNTTAGSAGHLKITAGKFYRVNGAGVQGSGVMPDVVLPGITNQLVEREAEQPFALAGDSITRRFNIYTRNTLPREMLRMKSAARISTCSAFADLYRLADSVAKYQQRPEKVALCISDLSNYTEKQKRLQQRLAGLLGAAPAHITVSLSEGNSRLIRMNTQSAFASREAMDAIRKDLVLHESFEILADLTETPASQ